MSDNNVFENNNNTANETEGGANDNNMVENNNTANETEGRGNDDDSNNNIDNGFSLTTTDVIVTYRVASNYAGDVDWDDIEDATDFINDFVLRQLSSSVLFNELSASVVSVTTDRQEPCGVFGNSLSIEELDEDNLDLYCFMLETTVTLKHPPSFEKELVRKVALGEVQSQIETSGTADFFKISVDFYETNSVSVGIIMNSYGASTTIQNTETQHIFENRTLEFLNYATPMAESRFTVDHVLIRKQYLTNVPSGVESDEVEEKSDVVRRLIETTKNNHNQDDKIMLTLKTLIIGSWDETSSKSSSAKSASFEDAVLESLITAPYPLSAYLRDTEQSSFKPIKRIEFYSLVNELNLNQTESVLSSGPSSQTHSLGAEGIAFILLLSHVVVIFSGLLCILQRKWREGKFPPKKGLQMREKLKKMLSDRGRSRKLQENTNNDIEGLEMFEDEPLALPVPLEKEVIEFPVSEVVCYPNEFYEGESTTVTEPLSKGTISRSEEDDITIPDALGRKETLKSIDEKEEGAGIPVGQEPQQQQQQDKQVVFPDLILDSPDNTNDEVVVTDTGIITGGSELVANNDIADVFPDVFNQNRSTLHTKEGEAPWFGEPSVREADFDLLTPATENQALLKIAEHDATL